jgi:hypothetical protein
MQKPHRGIKVILRSLAEFVCSHQKFALALVLTAYQFSQVKPI